MFYEFFVSYLTLVINFLKDRGSEEQILRDLTLAIQRAIARIHRGDLVHDPRSGSLCLPDSIKFK